MISWYPYFFVIFLETSIQIGSSNFHQLNQASVFCWRLLGRRSCRGSPAASEVLGTSWTVVCRQRLAKVPWGHFLLMTQESRHPPVSWDLVGSWNFPLFIGFLGLTQLTKNGCRISAINSYTWLVHEEKHPQSANNELASNQWLKQWI